MYTHVFFSLFSELFMVYLKASCKDILRSIFIFCVNGQGNMAKYFTTANTDEVILKWRIKMSKLIKYTPALTFSKF